MYSRPIVTQIVPLKAFYPAEAYHQDYMALHPTQPYIVVNDAPKVARSAAGLPRPLPEPLNQGGAVNGGTGKLTVER